MNSKNKWTTNISFPKAKKLFGFDHPICSLGSCFSENINTYLTERLLLTSTSPFGTIYNPLTLFTLLDKIINKELFEDTDLIKTPLGYTTLLHHSKFSNPDKNKFIENANHALLNFHSQLQKAELLFITLGSAYYFQHIEKNTLVNNCHKLNQNQFARKLASTTDIQLMAENTLATLKKWNPKISIIWSISPIRYTQAGGTENFLSKSILRCAIEPYIHQENNTYFPAYEILTDELRDYRFYDDSMTHPTTLAIQEICQRFIPSFFDKATIELLSKWEPILKIWKHHKYNGFFNTSDPSLESLKRDIFNFANNHNIKPNRLDYFLKQFP